MITLFLAENGRRIVRVPEGEAGVAGSFYSCRKVKERKTDVKQ